MGNAMKIQKSINSILNGKWKIFTGSMANIPNSHIITIFLEEDELPAGESLFKDSAMLLVDVRETISYLVFSNMQPLVFRELP